jgi:hypothetical protein
MDWLRSIRRAEMPMHVAVSALSPEKRLTKKKKKKNEKQIHKSKKAQQ